MTSRDIGLRVTRLREARRLTTVGLGGIVGLSQAQISRLENGKQGFRSTILARLADALSVPIFYFIMTDEQWETYQRGLEARGQQRIVVFNDEPGATQ